MQPSKSSPPVIRRPALPAVSILLLTVAAILHLGANPARTGKSFFEVLCHHLGHSINSIWILIGAILLVIPRQAQTNWDRWVWPLRLIEATVLNFAVTDAFFKTLLPLPRPNDPDHAGFPSGHAQFGFIMAWLIATKYPRFGPWWFAMAAIIAWSRVVVNAHFPYQVICGAIFGCILGWIVVTPRQGLLLTRLLRPKDPMAAEAGD